MRKLLFCTFATLAVLIIEAGLVTSDALAQSERTASQQRMVVAGVVVDQSGEPVIGATVLDKDSSKGVMTDAVGHFSLETKPGSNVLVTCIGYKDYTFRAVPGRSLKIVLEDDLMRLFGSDKIKGMMDKLGMEEDEPIENKIVTSSIENAQKKVEERNFNIRKMVLEYDDVMNQQREVIYKERRKVLDQEDLRSTVMEFTHKIVDRAMTMYCPPESYSEDWDLKNMVRYCEEFFAPFGELKEEMLADLGREEIGEYLHKLAEDIYASREEEISPEIMRELENLVMLKVVDNHWMEHLDAMDMLREGVGLRAYGQKDPLVEYKFEAFDMFEAMIEAIEDDVVKYMYRVNVISQPSMTMDDPLENATMNNPTVDTPEEEAVKQPVVNKGPEVGRNDPCPCGSGKKYKNCCGKGK